MSGVEIKNRSIIGLVLFGVTGGAGILLSAACVPFVLPAFRRICLPYVPATTEQIENVLTALAGRSGRLIDLGSGDGRIVISAAKAGFKADGIELNPWLVAYSKLAAFRSGVGKLTNFYRKNIWQYDLQSYPNIVIFGVEEMMEELEKKLVLELRDGACIVACRFPLPTHKPAATIGTGIDTVWLYKHNSNHQKI